MSLRTITLVVLPAVLAYVTQPPAASAEGALAIGTTHNLEEGSSFSWVVNARTTQGATNWVLDQCRSYPHAIQRVKSNCRVVATFRRECVAVAITERAPGFGWAAGPDRASAEQRAIATCQVTATKGGFCRVSAVACDVEEREDPRLPYR
jgi:hypothetical protein